MNTTHIEIGSLWSGRNVHGETVTLKVLSAPIPGNELRHVEYLPSGERNVVGKNWFRRAVRAEVR